MMRSLNAIEPRQRRAGVLPQPTTISPFSKLAEEVVCAAILPTQAPAAPSTLMERLAIVAAITDIVEIGSGQPVSDATRSSAHLHVMVEGWTHRSETTRSGGRQITDIYLPGDLCGCAWRAGGDPDADIRACGSARVAVLRKDALFARSSPMLWHSLERSVAAEVRRLRSRLVSMGRRDARGRIAHLISDLHERMRQVGLSDRKGFDCPLTQEQLADALGLTSVHVNRTLQALRREDIVSFQRGHIAIRSLARLHDVAEFDRPCNLSCGE